MSPILICPSPRAAVPLLSESTPLATAPLLGETLLEYWLSHFACVGATRVTILAHDRPEQVGDVTGDGARWGVQVELVAESRELTVGEAWLKHAPEANHAMDQSSIALLDHLPGFAEKPLFNSYAGWLEAVTQWLPRAITPDRVGVHETQPGIWVGRQSHISPDSALTAPCWVGNNVFVGSRAVLGPDCIVEDGAFIEPEAEITGSQVGADTYVGRFVRVSDSLVWGDTLLNWRTGSQTKVADPFLLCALRQPRAPRHAGWFSRLAQIYSRNKEEMSLLWKEILLNKHGPERRAMDVKGDS
jgi:hypothetical protein